MFTGPIKSIIVLIFFFAVLERTGVELISFVKWHLNSNDAVELFESSEGSKESEKKEGKSIKDLLFFDRHQSSLKIAYVTDSGKNLFDIIRISHSFYLVVPTPPPDLYLHLIS